MEGLGFTLSEKDLLEKVGAKAVILFGSQALGKARTTSDFDVGIIGQNRLEIYDLVYNLLAAKIDRLVNIDIVFLDEASLELRSHVAAYGKILYQKEPRVFADFRQKVMIEAADFAPLRAIFSAATLLRISP